jgi:hypothetical protein
MPPSTNAPFKLPKEINADPEVEQFDLWRPFTDDAGEPVVPACLQCQCIFVPGFDGKAMRYVDVHCEFDGHDCECHHGEHLA